MKTIWHTCYTVIPLCFSLHSVRASLDMSATYGAPTSPVASAEACGRVYSGGEGEDEPMLQGSLLLDSLIVADKLTVFPLPG